MSGIYACKTCEVTVTPDEAKFCWNCGARFGVPTEAEIEREECAKLAEEVGRFVNLSGRACCDHVSEETARQIRARGRR